jgi:Spermine/spermidine synthase domain
MQTVEAAVAAPSFRLGERPRLVLASFLMLFVELALIRWVAAYDVYVAFFTNFVLLASFLGIGVGFLRAHGPRDLSRFAPWAVAAVVVFTFVFPVTGNRSADKGGVHGLFGLAALPMWLELSIIFLGVTLAMACIAEGVARLFTKFEPLEAYRLDILGSLSGIIVFSLLAFLRTGPWMWGLVIGSALLALMPRGRDPRRYAALALVVLAFVLGSLSPYDTWSPYYRVTVEPASSEGRIDIVVNSLPHQSILPLDRLTQEQPFYLKPYTHLGGNPLGNVLIVGAGNGNDVAISLSKGAQHVDAVEIDPVIQATGRDQHPNHPYQDPRVTAHIDDGRAFLERTDQTYDLIIFALPDSLTLVSGQGSLRLESYLFTLESMENIRDHLKPGGAFAMYNYYTPFVFERYANTMDHAFGHEPCFDPGSNQALHDARQQAVLTIGRDEGDIQCDASAVWQPAANVPAPSTDDHPFPYIPGRAIPTFYLVAMGLILVASVVLVRVASRAPLTQMQSYVDLFFMGAAFLLLETKSVVQFALLFGTTWLVNSLVFAGILLAVLLAVEVARRVRLPRREVLYVLLALALAVAYTIPPAKLLSLEVVPRFLAAVSLAFAPVFLANLIFAQRFRDVGASTVAFGANLLGAMLGGVLEYTAIVFGYRNLLIVVAVLYALAFVVGRRHLGERDSVARAPRSSERGLVGS